jgi:citrate synthase
LHGGANEAVMRTLESIDGVDAVPGAVREILGSGAKIMGFGHRVYRTEDPRATHLRKLSQSIGELAGDTKWYEMSLAMEQAVMAEKGLYPNVDFYAARSASRPICSRRCSRCRGWRDGRRTSWSSTPTTG